MNQLRINSLKGEHSFNDVFRSGRKVREPLLHLYVRFVETENATTSEVCVGIVVRKKLVRRAVDRALFKRRIRAAFRLCAREHAELLQGVSSVAVVWQTPYKSYRADVSFAHVYGAIIHALGRIRKSTTGR
ncbi:MAG: ribonuclease P protein component [Candidatus Kapaibacterium sp.]|jgi:ribonuclease P protein component